MSDKRDFSILVLETSTNVFCDVASFLNDKHYVLDGIDGTFRHTHYVTANRQARVVCNLQHVPSEIGKQTPEYLERKHALHDDWFTEMSDTRMFQIALDLGIQIV